MEWAYPMSTEGKGTPHVLETKLTYPETAIGDVGVLLWKGGIVPRTDVVAAKANGAYAEGLGLSCRVCGGIRA